MSLARRIAVFLLVAVGVQSCVLGAGLLVARDVIYESHPTIRNVRWHWFVADAVTVPLIVLEFLVLQIGSLVSRDLLFAKAGRRGRFLPVIVMFLIWLGILGSSRWFRPSVARDRRMPLWGLWLCGI